MLRARCATWKCAFRVWCKFSICVGCADCLRGVAGLMCVPGASADTCTPVCDISVAVSSRTALGSIGFCGCNKSHRENLMGTTCGDALCSPIESHVCMFACAPGHTCCSHVRLDNGACRCCCAMPGSLRGFQKRYTFFQFYGIAE